MATAPRSRLISGPEVLCSETGIERGFASRQPLAAYSVAEHRNRLFWPYIGQLRRSPAARRHRADAELSGPANRLTQTRDALIPKMRTQAPQPSRSKRTQTGDIVWRTSKRQKAGDIRIFRRQPFGDALHERRASDVASRLEYGREVVQQPRAWCRVITDLRRQRWRPPAPALIQSTQSKRQVPPRDAAAGCDGAWRV